MSSGMGLKHTATVQLTGNSSQRRVSPSAQTGNAPRAASPLDTPSVTSAQDVAVPIMAPKSALEQRRLKALTPYNPAIWEELLLSSGLLSKYPNIPESLRLGFTASMPPILSSYIPDNNSSVRNYKDTFNKMLSRELALGRYLGPFSQTELESAIGKFQTSPLSIIPKPGKPGKFRFIQNLSFPHNPTPPLASINSRINADCYPCTYGTFDIISLLIWHLPPGSQAAIRDVSEAYRTVPLHPSEWPGLVVRIDQDQFAVDTCFCFGFGPSGGIYGNLASAGADILRAGGIGPISRWVDNHIFFRIRKEFLLQFNQKRALTAELIRDNGGQQSSGGRIWYPGDFQPNGSRAEFDDDHVFPLVDLSSDSPRSEEDQKYTYNFEDIDRISRILGIPWEPSKDIPFSPSVTYLGFTWDLDNRTVTLSDSKRTKYIQAIDDWRSSRTHPLADVQKLYGKLLHASHVIPAGRAYLTSLEAMLAIFGDTPFKPRTPPHRSLDDLSWWHQILNAPPPSPPHTRSHPNPQFQCFL